MAQPQPDTGATAATCVIVAAEPAAAPCRGCIAIAITQLTTGPTVINPR
jgi:hypothetical protein